MEMLRELITINEINQPPVPFFQALNEAVKELEMAKVGGKVTFKDASDFFKANPSLAILGGALALSAYHAYKRNKRNTIHLFATDAYERRMMTDIVDALTKNSLFKVQLIKHHSGGKSWLLKRVRAVR